MTGTVIFILASVVIAGGALFLLFARWASRSWAVLEDDYAGDRQSRGGVWSWLLGRAGRSPRRLTYRRDERGRFRKHRR